MNKLIQPIAVPEKPGHAWYGLTLSLEPRREIHLRAPHSVTPAEMARIQAWIALQLFVDEEPVPTALSDSCPLTPDLSQP